jgi:hypothetical protein
MSATQTLKNEPVYPAHFHQKPFFDLTVEMLDCVSKHNFERLAEICDDDYGIIDIDVDGGSKVIRDRKGWEDWFQGLFPKLNAMHAQTWSEITHYESVKMMDMGYGVVDFNQILQLPDKKLAFKVIATIIWKFQDGEWKESRYHSSMLGVSEIE